ncbi:hypothetical protein TM239_01060 [Bradyrhizobium sp. TM239]|nr:hypothetical protein TM239_01060 [Bradyrhizobium sp. TM239]
MFGCWAALVEPLPDGDCAWLVFEERGFALCVWLLVLDGELVCAWLDGVVDWFDG